MPGIKDRFRKWKENRSAWQKAGDIFFWLLLLLLLIPGPRKIIATGFNTVMLQFRAPRANDLAGQPLSPEDLQWKLVDAEGKVQSFDFYLGKPVFLNFWATWCPPCVAELPEIRKAYEKHGEKVHFLLVSNQDPAEVKAFLSKRKLDLPVFFPGGSLPDGFMHNSLPTTFVISADGRIVERTKGAANWDSRATEKLFDNLLR